MTRKSPSILFRVKDKIDDDKVEHNLEKNWVSDTLCKMSIRYSPGQKSTLPLIKLL